MKKAVLQPCSDATLVRQRLRGRIVDNLQTMASLGNSGM